MTEENGNPPQPELFAVYAETRGNSKALILTGLTFARLMDDVVVPYQSEEPFFVDGAPVKPTELIRIKVIRQMPSFTYEFQRFHMHMRNGDVATKRLHAEQYSVMLEAMLRDSGEDVTSQIIKAYDKTIKPSLRDYLPRREELIQAAWSVFFQGIQALGKTMT